MIQCHNFLLRADMNGDSIVTVSDLWMQFKTIWFMPSNFVVEKVLGAPALAQFLEFNCSSGQGFIGGAASMIFWVVSVVIFSALVVGIGQLTKTHLLSEKRRA